MHTAPEFKTNLTPVEDPNVPVVLRAALNFDCGTATVERRDEGTGRRDCVSGGGSPPPTACPTDKRTELRSLLPLTRCMAHE